MTNIIDGTGPGISGRGRVFLVGAGPGDASLLTIKAARVLAESDVVVYDALVGDDVLGYARPGALLVPAGKRGGQSSTDQREINRLLVEHARRGRVVARLKGGDPFLFGRGAEEAEALTEAGVAWEVVPGLSSGTAIPALAGIPLTHRALASSVAFLPGHSAERSGAVAWELAAWRADTLVIFMCAATIGEIAGRLVAGGRPTSTPVAVVQRGTYEDEETLLSTLGALGAAAAEGRLAVRAPALAVVGEVVTLAARLDLGRASRHGRRVVAAERGQRDEGEVRHVDVA